MRSAAFPLFDDSSHISQPVYCVITDQHVGAVESQRGAGGSEGVCRDSVKWRRNKASWLPARGGKASGSGTLGLWYVRDVVLVMWYVRVVVR